MARKVAAACSLLAFSICLVFGIMVGNTFSTTVLRGLLAMLITFIVGIVVGSMWEKMYEEHLKSRAKIGNSEVETGADDR